MLNILWIAKDIKNLPLIFSGIFYGVLCIFSVVTGIIYISGKRKLNPIELPDKFIKNKTKNELENFAVKMGVVTFIVGIVQGITSIAILLGNSPVFYWIALGFTIFSILSVLFKLKNKVNAFPLVKLIFYVTILIILMLESTRAIFF